MATRKILNGSCSVTSPAAATAANSVDTLIGPFDVGDVDTIRVIAELVGATGGTLDIYIQMQMKGDTDWFDYVHFAQQAAGGAANFKTFAVSRASAQTTMVTPGKNGVPAIAANTVVGGDFGNAWRVVCVAGASTSAGAALVFHFCGAK